MQLDEIRRIALQQFLQLTNMTLDFDLDRFVPLDMFEIDGKFHVCTRRKIWKRGGRRGSDQRTTSRRSITAGKLRGNDAWCSQFQMRCHFRSLPSTLLAVRMARRSSCRN